MSGSFWKFSNGFTSLSNISTLLENYNRDLESGKVEEEGQLEVLKKLLDEMICYKSYYQTILC